MTLAKSTCLVICTALMTGCGVPAESEPDELDESSASEANQAIAAVGEPPPQPVAAATAAAVVVTTNSRLLAKGPLFPPFPPIPLDRWAPPGVEGIYLRAISPSLLDARTRPLRDLPRDLGPHSVSEPEEDR